MQKRIMQKKNHTFFSETWQGSECSKHYFQFCLFSGQGMGASYEENYWDGRTIYFEMKWFMLSYWMETKYWEEVWGY